MCLKKKRVFLNISGARHSKLKTQYVRPRREPLWITSDILGYITYFLGLLKIQENFTVSVVLYVVMLLSTISAFGLIEVVGRRPLLVWGMAFLAFVQIVRWYPFVTKASSH